ncbi:asparaginase [Halobium salinum]|uniref:L-asparaginase n=1 Tax=Halobium salinum TaxID=1364940 RepID=A0ABD5PI89_9EURY|nr:asparaginase [Halobium salinum]
MDTQVTVLSTGGTIASTESEAGATPKMGGEELVAAVPEIEEYASLTVEQVAQRPSFDMDFETLGTLHDAALDAADAGADGVVVTHGTDTMEESAYALDLLLDLPVPVVFTGAQRRPDQVSPDGPANLLAAVRAAAHERLAGEGGVYLAFNETLHAARDVTKTHTSRLETFASPDAGPVAHVDGNGVRFTRPPGSHTAALPIDGEGFETTATLDVEMVKTGAGVDGRQVRRALDAGVDGLVVEGTGLGNVTAALGDAVADAVDAGVPVVVTSRCLAGRVAPQYGTGGGGATLASHGALPGDDLPAHKARIRLLLALAVADEAEDVSRFFDDW